MNRIALYALPLLLASIPAGAADPPFTGCPKPFSAKVTDSTAPRDVTELACQGMRTRMAPPGGNMVMIGELDSGRLLMVFPQTREYFEIRGRKEDIGAFDPCTDQKRLVKDNPAVTCRKTGTAVVNGRNADRYETKGGTLKEPIVTWFDPELRVILKEQRGKDVSELKDVKIGSPGVSFEVPAGYRKLSDQEYAARIGPGPAPAPEKPSQPKK